MGSNTSAIDYKAEEDMCSGDIERVKSHLHSVILADKMSYIMIDRIVKKSQFNILQYLCSVGLHNHQYHDFISASMRHNNNVFFDYLFENLTNAPLATKEEVYSYSIQDCVEKNRCDKIEQILSLAIKNKATRLMDHRLLQAAVSNNKLFATKMLLEHCSWLNINNNNGCLLLLAFYHCHFTMVTFLVDSGIECKRMDEIFYRMLDVLFENSKYVTTNGNLLINIPHMAELDFITVKEFIIKCLNKFDHLNSLLHTSTVPYHILKELLALKT